MRLEESLGKQYKNQEKMMSWIVWGGAWEKAKFFSQQKATLIGAITKPYSVWPRQQKWVFSQICKAGALAPGAGCLGVWEDFLHVLRSLPLAPILGCLLFLLLQRNWFYRMVVLPPWPCDLDSQVKGMVSRHSHIGGLGLLLICTNFEVYDSTTL